LKCFFVDKMSVPTKRISYTCTTYEEANTQISDDQSHVNQKYSLETLAVFNKLYIQTLNSQSYVYRYCFT